MQSNTDAKGVGMEAVVWIAVAISLAIWAFLPSYNVGWDVSVYRKALESLRAGRDPYQDAMAIQRAYYAALAQHQHDPLPFSYVYSPITLPVLGWIARAPFRVSAAVYWVVYGACAVLILRFGSWMAERGERRLVRVLAPVCLFFPGLLQHDTIFSGNVAVVLYGCVLTACCFGWKREVWSPFYALVILASCVKAPLLCLVAIPALSARRQWLPAGLSASVGVALFALQPRLWPALFHHYLEAVDLQFRFNRDFSSSPAGVAADLLFGKVPYQVTSLAVYLLCAATVGGLLLGLSRRYLAGDLQRKQWVPVMIVGVFLLNPRLMEYDLLPLSLPMLLILWRSLGRSFSRRGQVAGTLVPFLCLNVCVILGLPFKPTECLILLAVFGLGCRELWLQSLEARRERVGFAQATVAATDPLSATSGRLEAY